MQRGFHGGAFGYLSGAEDHTDQQVPVCKGCTDNQLGGGCVDLWRDLAPAHGENGTYNGYSFAAQVCASCLRSFEHILVHIRVTALQRTYKQKST